MGGNLRNDLAVVVRSSLLLASSPPFDAGMPQGRPMEVEAPVVTHSSCGGTEGTHHETVQQMREQLRFLSWKSYMTYFTGEAHVKICSHPVGDTSEEGTHVVDHICAHFLCPE